MARKKAQKLTNFIGVEPNFFHLTSFAQNEEFHRKFHTKNTLFHTKSTLFYTKSALLYTKNTLFYTKFTPFSAPFSTQNHTAAIKNDVFTPYKVFDFPPKISPKIFIVFFEGFFSSLTRNFQSLVKNRNHGRDARATRKSQPRVSIKIGMPHKAIAGKCRNEKEINSCA